MDTEHVYYDRAATDKLYQGLYRSLRVLEVPRQLPRPWPMFCGESLDNRPIMMKKRLEK